MVTIGHSFEACHGDENTEASVHTAARNLAKFIRETLSSCGRPRGLAQHILHETCLREMFRTFRWIWFGTILRSSNEYVCFKSLDFQEVDLLSIFPQGSMNVSSPTACLKKCLPVAQLQQSSCASQLKSYLYKDFFVASPYLTKRFCWVHGFWGVRTSKELTGSFSSVCQNYAGKKVLKLMLLFALNLDLLVEAPVENLSKLGTEAGQHEQGSRVLDHDLDVSPILTYRSGQAGGRKCESKCGQEAKHSPPMTLVYTLTIWGVSSPEFSIQASQQIVSKTERVAKSCKKLRYFWDVRST